MCPMEVPHNVRIVWPKEWQITGKSHFTTNHPIVYSLSHSGGKHYITLHYLFSPARSNADDFTCTETESLASSKPGIWKLLYFPATCSWTRY